MSVINDMLNDLEQRQHQPHPAPANSDYQPLNGVAPGVDRGRYVWWLMGLPVVAVCAWFAWQPLMSLVTDSHAVPAPVVSLPENTTVIEPVVSDLPLKNEPPAPGEPEPAQVVQEVFPPAARLSRIVLGEHGGIVGVDMAFSQPLAAPLLQYRKGDRIWMRLFAASESNIELPELPEHGLIKSWQSYLEDGYQIITLGVEPSVDADLFQLSAQEWRLNLQAESVELKDPPEVVDEIHQVSEPAVKQSLPKREQQKSQQSSEPFVKPSKHRVKTAEAALANGKPAKAETLLKEVLTLQPDHLAASQLLGRLYLEDGRLELAESVTLSALQQHPDQAELISYFTRSLLGQQRLSEAGEYLVRAMHEGYAPHQGLMAVIRQRQGEHSEASRYYKLALQSRPNEATWLTGLGISQEHLNERAAARQAYQRSLASGRLSVALRGFVEERLERLNKY